MKIIPVPILLALSVFVPVASVAAETMFVHLAEGYTSEDERAGIVAAQRIFSAPMFADLCPPLRVPARLDISAPQPLRLVRGQWFDYVQLVVQALDTSGLVLPPTPITVEVEDTTPPVLDLRSDMTAGPDGRVLPIRTGKFKLRIRTLCEGHTAVAVVEAEVIDQ